MKLIIKLKILEYKPYYFSKHFVRNYKTMILTMIIVVNAKINKIAEICNL